jgi:hypothetical protein
MALVGKSSETVPVIFAITSIIIHYGTRERALIIDTAQGKIKTQNEP